MTQREELLCKAEKRRSCRTGCEDHESSVGPQFGQGERSFDSGSVSVPRD